MENKTDRLECLISILNDIDSDVVRFNASEYTVNGSNYIKICFTKNGISTDVMTFSTSTDNIDGLRSMCAKELIRYLMFSKDTSNIDYLYGRLIYTYSAKTIFNRNGK